MLNASAKEFVPSNIIDFESIQRHFTALGLSEQDFNVWYREFVTDLDADPEITEEDLQNIAEYERLEDESLAEILAEIAQLEFEQ